LRRGKAVSSTSPPVLYLDDPWDFFCFFCGDVTLRTVRVFIAKRKPIITVAKRGNEEKRKISDKNIQLEIK
jgi:hypothetical protein